MDGARGEAIQTLSDEFDADVVSKSACGIEFIDRHDGSLFDGAVLLPKQAGGRPIDHHGDRSMAQRSRDSRPAGHYDRTRRRPGGGGLRTSGGRGIRARLRGIAASRRR